MAEAYASLAWSALHYDYNFADAEGAFERSIEMNSRSATAHHWFGMTLGMMGRYEEGYTELKRAIRLDPYWSWVHFGMAFVYWCGHRYDQAIEECHEALELDAKLPQTHVWLGLSYVARLMWEPAIAALHEAVELSRRTPVAVACLGEAYAAAGFTDEARHVLRELSGKAHVTADFVSRIHAALGESNEAIDWLGIAFKQHGEWIVLLKIDPRFDSLHDDPRFKDLMRRMNFPGPTKTVVPSPR